jgi:hypothetical protein
MAELNLTCNVDRVGPASDGAETTQPVVYVALTDTASPPSWTGSYWFFAADNAKDEILAVALMARALSRTVDIHLAAPNTGNNPYTEVHRIYLG